VQLFEEQDHLGLVGMQLVDEKEDGGFHLQDAVWICFHVPSDVHSVKPCKAFYLSRKLTVQVCFKDRGNIYELKLLVMVSEGGGSRLAGRLAHVPSHMENMATRAAFSENLA